MSKRLLPYLALFVASIIWGITAPVIKNTLNFVEPLTLLFWRFLFAVVISSPFLVFYLKKNPIKLSWLPKLFTIAVLGGVLPLILGFYGLKYTSSVEAVLIGSLSPLSVAITASFYLKEKLSKKELVGISLAVAGTFSVAIEPFFQAGLAGDNRLLGNFLIFLSIISWVFCVMLAKHWQKAGMQPFHITSFTFIVGLLILTPLASIQSGSFPTVDFSNPNILYPVLYLSIFSSLVAYTLYYMCLARVHAAQADIFGYLHGL